MPKWSAQGLCNNTDLALPVPCCIPATAASANLQAGSEGLQGLLQ